MNPQMGGILLSEMKYKDLSQPGGGGGGGGKTVV